MHRLFRLSFLLVLFSILTYTVGHALQPQLSLSGRVEVGDVRVLLKDTVYYINNEYVVKGTLIIEPGTTIYFYPNSRLVDSCGGRIIADGFATATYKPNPYSGSPWNIPIDPKEVVGSTSNPYHWIGYNDLKYFLYGTAKDYSYLHYINNIGGYGSGPDADRTIVVQTPYDYTVDTTKYRQIFDVVLDTAGRRLRNLQGTGLGTSSYPYPTNGLYRIPFEYAIMFMAARMNVNPVNDYNLARYPWSRIGNLPVNITPGQINFVGQPTRDFGREWGHIIILPGARAAFFRNCVFNGLRKDTTVDRTGFYNQSDFPMLTATQLATLNQNMKMSSNGGGGALTTFSSRTWLLNCVFTCNLARHKGGALQILQSPEGFPRPAVEPDWFRAGKNPNLTDRDGVLSRINTFLSNAAYSNIKAIDYADENLNLAPSLDEPFTNYDRQYWDDGRIGVYLGRFRNLYFTNNYAQLANVTTVVIGTPPIQVVRDDTTGAADAPQYYGDIAYGGAIYMAGASGTYTENAGSHSGFFGTPTGFRTDPIEIGLGVNNSINTYDNSGNPTLHSFPLLDSLTCNGNFAYNYQNVATSNGARGGAIYVGKYTSLIVAGELDNNAAVSPLMQNDTTSSNSGYFARGGAIFLENSKNRLQVRGGPNRDFGNNIDNPTEFLNNKAGSGGAIYIDPITNYYPSVLPWEPTGQYSSYLISPVIGGSDAYIYTRDYGFNITFRNNVALSYGGAIFTNRNMLVTGAGGVTNNTFLGYGGAFPVMFDANNAGYSGGAVHIRVTDNAEVYPNIRTVQMVRASFRNNIVGASIVQANKPQIRGGGAIYCQGADLNLMKGVEFKANTVYNANGGAISLVIPHPTNKRFFLTDLDHVAFVPGVDKPAISYTSENDVLAYHSSSYTPDSRMLTTFLDNQILCDSLLLASQSGSGTTQIGIGTPAFDQALYGVCFLDETNGYVVGESGTIIKLSQGGNLWQYISSGTTNTLRDIDFLTDKVGYIVGENGTVLLTTDAGLHWTPQSITPLSGWNPAVQNFYGVKFSGSSSNIGYLVGTNGFIAKITVNLVGGNYVGSSVVQVESGTIHDLYGVYFNSVHQGYAVGHRGLIIKLNEYDIWDGQISNIFTDLRSVYFTNDYTGYAVGDYGVLLMTTNSGSSWDYVNTGTTLPLNKVWFTGLNVGYIAGENGVMLKSTDAGLTWNPLNPGTADNLNSIFFKIPAVGYIVGDNGFIARTTDAGNTWVKKVSQDLQYVDVVRRAQEVKLPENGIGLGGAIYILDSVTSNRVNRTDSIHFNRSRMEKNFAYTGSAVYSDNYDLKLIFNRSLIVNNMVDPRNTIGIYQNAITGAVLRDSSKVIIANRASSDLASTCLYGEIQGPLPSFDFSEAANSIYNNTARFLIRLPDAPNTKGVLSGLATGVGFGGTDTLRGNYWGKTEANFTYVITDSCVNCPGRKYKGAYQETFFLDTMDLVGPYTYQRHKYLDFAFWETNQENKVLHDNPRYNSYLFQGPFEAMTRFNYQPIPLLNKIGADENTPADSSIPEILVMSGRVYDVYDKGTDVKTADYSARRMSPIEDFAVGIPPVIRNYTDVNQPSYGKYVKCWVRDPFISDSLDANNSSKYPIINTLQTEFKPWVSPTKDTMYYHPIGYPLFLETAVNYNGIDERTNQDNRLLNESVFFVINETTNDYIRVNLKQVSDEAPYREIFRGKIDFVPDSTNRNANTTIRRTYEGLSNYGSDIGDPHLLRALYQNPYNEDAATLQGRKYHAPKNGLGNDATIYSNRPDMPTSNNKFNVNYETYFAGERFHALPVNVGDSISVVSRTVLWRQGVDSALRKGLGFRITNSTMPPEFTGDIWHLQHDTIVKYVPSEYPWRNKNGVYDTLKITDFLNKVFLTEDREYPKPVGTYSQPNANIGVDAVGRDRIMNATATDFNNFYDPRSFPLGDSYAQLYFRMAPANSSEGLNYWLKSELIPAVETYITNPVNTGDALGYLILRGRPTNPYVVPGGEEAIIYAQNYPPHYRTTDSMLATPVNTFTQDEIDKFIYLFQPYLHAPTYDSYLNARYLNQDTVNNGVDFTNEYHFKIFVTDSVPRFLSPDDPVQGYPTPNPNLPEDVTVTLDSKGQNNIETIGTYTASDYPCRMRLDGRLKANLTNKLRFQADFNSNDEQEDSWAEAKNWDFRYGRTAYGFLNVAYRPNDNTGRGGDGFIIIDTNVTRVTDPNNGSLVDVVQSRPLWMANDYLNKYNKDNEIDQFGADFTIHGQLNIRIDSTIAMRLLLPKNQYNGALNTDTMMTIVVNDGHGGLNKMDLPVFVNVEPIILTTTLPDAKEDYEYNPQLLDSARMIKIFDANFNQYHTFEVLYPTSTRPDTIWRDPCFPDADPTNFWYIGDKKTTPDWFRINKESGLCYGKPGILDAPRTDTITVIVTDDDGLTKIRTYTIFVDSTNHTPRLLQVPNIKCVELNKPYDDYIIVKDRDLMRNGEGGITDTLTIAFLPPLPNGMTISPNPITGVRTTDTVHVRLHADSLNVFRDPDGMATIKIRVTDKAGNSDTLWYRIQVSEHTDFTCPIKVSNHQGAYQILQFGTAVGATTGEHIGATDGPLGKLDSNFCEFELPPLPQADVFDARWDVSTTNGILRDIFPRGDAITMGTYLYKGEFQSGGEAGNTSNHYPVVISWSPNDIPAINDAVLNPSGGTWRIKDAVSNGQVFNYNMKNGLGVSVSNVIMNITTDTLTLSINRQSTKSFVIEYDVASDVNDQPVAGLDTKINSVTPNPFSSTTEIKFTVNGKSNVRMELVDELGKIVTVLTDAPYTTGEYKLVWDGRDMSGRELASGTYICRMVAGSYTSTEKLVIIR